MKDKEEAKFEEARKKIGIHETDRKSIGLLSEKTLHAVVKEFYCDNPEKQEIPVANYVADILVDDCIIEIQNGNFTKLRPKLDTFLKNYAVTVAFPLPAVKTVTWIDPETGEIVSSRKSPKKGSPCNAAKELIKIRNYLDKPNLFIDLLMVDMEEIRWLDGWSHNKKRGSHRLERMPLRLDHIVHLNKKEDYLAFIPDKLKEIFTAKEFAKAAKITTREAQILLLILFDLKVLDRIGKDGKAYLYKIAKKN